MGRRERARAVVDLEAEGCQVLVHGQVDLFIGGLPLLLLLFEIVLGQGTFMGEDERSTRTEVRTWTPQTEHEKPKEGRDTRRLQTRVHGL